MFTIIRRMLASLLCAAILVSFSAALAADENEKTVIPMTRSWAAYTANGVTVTGTRAMVDFDLLTQLNADTVGWLYQEETALSQPILQGETNSDYDTHAFDGTRLNGKGSVALDVANSRDMSSTHLVLYGNGRTGSCFEPLNEYDTQAYYDAHRSFRLLTPNGDWHADAFAFIQSSQRDDESWRVPQDAAQQAAWLEGILAQNQITPAADCLPKEGDRLLVLVINNTSPRRNVLYCVLRPITYATTADVNVTKATLDSIQTQNGYAEVGPLGTMMVYAQNDPIWDRMRYESARNSTFRVFGGGGCGPTAAAIAIANLADKEDLPKLSQCTKEPLGTLFCICSVNRVYCTHLHVPYQLKTPEEYFRYLPVVMADLAAGNNQWGKLWRRVGSTGSGIGFLEYVCEALELPCTSVNNLTTGLEMLKGKAGRGLLVCTALRKSPYTNSSHYVVIAGVDDEYLYVLDPQRRDDYSTTDKRGILELLSPGVTRIKLSQYGASDLTPAYYIERKDAAADVTAFGSTK